MKEFLNDAIKDASALIHFKYLHRGADFSIVKREFPAAMTVRKFDNARQLWDYAFENFGLSTKPITYVEFGVWKGESIKYFASKNDGDESLFIGLDSFEGLPEEWFGHFSKGDFSADGTIPEVDDKRIHFIKGWFQDTWIRAQHLISGATSNELLVHFDADLYSSTLFALTSLNGLGKDYLAIFDEFSGEESRALYNYRQAYGARIEFLAGAPSTRKYPVKTLCRVVPKPPSSPP
jgi:hypothetical protein